MPATIGKDSARVYHGCRSLIEYVTPDYTHANYSFSTCTCVTMKIIQYCAVRQNDP